MTSIAKKYVKVMEACGYIQKKGRNDFHRYNYAMASDVLEKVNEACVANGIATLANVEVISIFDVTTNKGNIEKLATVRTIYTLMCTDTGETMQISGIGSGQDAGDKAIMKAETASAKYAWMLSMNISTGDDPEADTSVDERMNGVKNDVKKGSGKKTTPVPEEKNDIITFGKYKGQSLKEIVKTDRNYVKSVADGDWQGYGAVANAVLEANLEENIA